MSTPVDLTEGLDGAKLAVTVLMIRDSPTGLEVYVQERVSSMPTFPNATVFPGGGVDPRDFELDGVESEHETFGGPSLMHWARSLGTNRNRARALLFAAARELFEETGTLLATHSDGTPIPDATQYHPQRLALESHRLSLSQVLARHDLTLRSEWLRPSARWVSPETDEKRFDMFAFVAVQPPRTRTRRKYPRSSINRLVFPITHPRRMAGRTHTTRNPNMGTTTDPQSIRLCARRTRISSPRRHDTHHWRSRRRSAL